MKADCLIRKVKARGSVKWKLFSMVFPYCTFSLSTSSLLLISSNRECQEVQLQQKNSGGRVQTEECLSLGVEQVGKRNCTQHQSRVLQFIQQRIGCYFQVCISILCVQLSYAQTYWRNPNLTPYNSIPLIFLSPKTNNTIKHAGGRFTPNRKGQP